MELERSLHVENNQLSRSHYTMDSQSSWGLWDRSSVRRARWTTSNCAACQSLIAAGTTADRQQWTAQHSATAAWPLLQLDSAWITQHHITMLTGCI